MDKTFSCIIADDEPVILQNLCSSPIWEELGIKIISSFDNGEDAYKAIVNLKPDFAIIDIKMPKMTGIDVMKKCQESGARTEIIIISGYDEFSYAKEAIKYGACAYILKPIDYSELSEELGLLISKAQNHQKIINPNRPATTFFKDLIDGIVIDSSVIPRMLPSLNESIADTECYVIVILFSGKLANSEYKEIFPIIEDSIPNNIRHKMWFQNSKSIVGIFNLSTETPFEIASNIVDNLRLKGYVDVWLSIGDVVPGLYQCSYSYNRAITALTYRIYNNERNIFTFLDICTTAPPHPIDIDCSEAIDAIISNKEVAMERFCKKFIDSLLYVAMPSPNYIYSNCQLFISKIKNELKVLFPKNLDIYVYIKQISSAESLEDISICLVGFLKHVAEYILDIYGKARAEILLSEAKGLLADDDLIKRAKIFIKENIHNKIQIPDIAESVNLSASYFSIYFKNKTGITLRDYLLDEKMEWACKTLIEDNANVDTISSDLGYSDYHAFSRAFKKKYKKTPSTFAQEKRDENKKNN